MKTNDGLTPGGVDKDALAVTTLVATDVNRDLVSIPGETAGYVLTSTGTGLPTFQALGGFTGGILAVANGGTGVATATGTGSTVLSNSPTLVTPQLGNATATEFVAPKIALGNIQGVGSGLYYWTPGDTNFAGYMAEAGLGKSLNAGIACTGGNVTTFAVRNRMDPGAGFGWIWENKNEVCQAALSAVNGDAYFKGILSSDSLTNDTVLGVNGAKQIVSKTATGTGAVVLADRPSLTGGITLNNTTAIETSIVYTNPAGDWSVGLGVLGTGTNYTWYNGLANVVMTLTRPGLLSLTSLTPSQLVVTDGSKNLTSLPSSTAGFVLTSNGSALPSFQPPSGFAGVLAVANGGTGVTTSTGTGSTVLSNNPTLVSPQLVTPTLGAATATSLTVTGIAPLQVVATDASSQLSVASTTGSGVVVLSTNPTLVTPVLGTATATQIASPKLVLGDVQGIGSGLYYWNVGNTAFAGYMAEAGLGNSLNGGTACTGGQVTTFAIRTRMDNGGGFGWIWESSADVCMASISAVTGAAYFKDAISTSAPVTTVAGSLAGNAYFSQPFQGTSYKKVVIRCDNLDGTPTYTFPTPFAFTPTIITTNSLASGTITTLTTTSVTLSAFGVTGFLFLEGV